MIAERLIGYRKHLHAHPELSGQEYGTSAYIRNTLFTTCPSARFFDVAKTGLIVQFAGKDSREHVLLRCELDALPIDETQLNVSGHGSKVVGVSHKCGHDGHMAILMGVAEQLEKSPPPGTVSLLFQPAEETGQGARAVLKDPVFDKVCRPKHVFALHNIPGKSTGEIWVKPGVFTASVISVKVTLKGRTAHAGEPWNGTNPCYTISKIISSAKALETQDLDSPNFRLVTPVYINAGSEDFGIGAGCGELGFTLRAKSNEQLEKLKKLFESVVKSLCKAYKLTNEMLWLAEFRAVQNSKKSVTIIKEAATQSKIKIVDQESPFSWGEDFGLFTEKYQGAMFAVGSGTDTPPLHHQDYDFPDEVIAPCVDLFGKIIKKVQH